MTLLETLFPTVSDFVARAAMLAGLAWLGWAALTGARDVGLVEDEPESSRSYCSLPAAHAGPCSPESPDPPRHRSAVRLLAEPPYDWQHETV